MRLRPLAPPDEVLHNILSLVLEIDDRQFTNKSYTLVGHSHPLLVCKTWLRISTPLFYKVVVLTSKAQARALAWTLKENEGLGSFIRKLRSSGGFGPSMETIMLASLKITDLCLEFYVRSRDSVAGLCKGLLALSPTRLTLHGDMSRQNAQVRQLSNGICQCLKLWTNMVWGYSIASTSAHETVSDND
jgi:hypothetical protein